MLCSRRTLAWHEKHFLSSSKAFRSLLNNEVCRDEEQSNYLRFEFNECRRQQKSAGQLVKKFTREKKKQLNLKPWQYVYWNIFNKDWCMVYLIFWLINSNNLIHILNTNVNKHCCSFRYATSLTSRNVVDVSGIRLDPTWSKPTRTNPPRQSPRALSPLGCNPPGHFPTLLLKCLA